MYGCLKCMGLHKLKAANRKMCSTSNCTCSCHAVHAVIRLHLPDVICDQASSAQRQRHLRDQRSLSAASFCRYLATHPARTDYMAPKRKAKSEDTPASATKKAKPTKAKAPAKGKASVNSSVAKQQADPASKVKIADGELNLVVEHW